MSSTALKQTIRRALDELPPEVLPEVVDFLDFLRFRASRGALSPRVKEAVRLYATGEVSLGRAAELAGMNYFLFEQLLSTQAVSPMEPEVTNVVAQQELADEVLA